jgi:hypothetical protein
MAHFAKISEENVVLLVTPVDNKDLLDENKVEQESLGQAYLEKHSNWPAHLWIKTSYNTKNNTHTLDGTPFRGNYAGIGYTWDAANQIFWPPKPYDSWVKNVAEARWQSPVGDSPESKENPLDRVQTSTPNNPRYSWDEVNQQWVKTSDYYNIINDPNYTP